MSELDLSEWIELCLHKNYTGPHAEEFIDGVREYEERIRKLEAKLAKAVGATEVLNAACDAMWNDHERLEENPSRFGQPYRLKENHMRAISEAQQKLPVTLAELKGQDDE